MGGKDLELAGCPSFFWHMQWVQRHETPQLCLEEIGLSANRKCLQRISGCLGDIPVGISSPWKNPILHVGNERIHEHLHFLRLCPLICFGKYQTVHLILSRVLGPLLFPGSCRLCAPRLSFGPPTNINQHQPTSTNINISINISIHINQHQPTSTNIIIITPQKWHDITIIIYVNIHIHTTIPSPPFTPTQPAARVPSPCQDSWCLGDEVVGEPLSPTTPRVMVINGDLIVISGGWWRLMVIYPLVI